MNDHLYLGSHSHGQIHVQQLFEPKSSRQMVLRIQQNGLTTVSKTRLLVVSEWQLESIHRWQGSSTSMKSLEGIGKMKATPMAPKQAMKQYMQKLISFEHHEIFSYPEIHFFGPRQRSTKAGPTTVAMMMTRDVICRCTTILWLTGMRCSRLLGGELWAGGHSYHHKVHQHVALKMVWN